MPGTPHTNYSFPQKVWIACGITSFVVLCLLLVKITISLLLLIFAAILISVFFRGLSSLIENKTKWNTKITLAISVILTLCIVAFLTWLIEVKAQPQIEELTVTLPETVKNIAGYLNQSKLGQKIINSAYSKETQDSLKVFASRFFKTSLGIVGDFYVIIFLSVFFTSSPSLYINGILRLVPTQGQKNARLIFTKVYENLKKWMKGKLFAMLVVFILTSIGLLILGLPMWIALAIIAGILNFIPNFGPIIAMIPAVLVGLLQGPVTAGYVVGLYVLVQVAESNFITPLVQQKLVKIPPALIIIAQLLLGILTGGWGILLATPIMIIAMVVVEQLYMKNSAGNTGAENAT